MKTLTLALAVLAVLLASASIACYAGFLIGNRKYIAERDALTQARLEQLAEQQRGDIEEVGARFNSQMAKHRKELNEVIAQNAELSNRIAALTAEGTVRTNRTLLPLDGLVDLGNLAPIDLKGGRAWGPEQATGEPDTHTAGDQQTAWASLTQDGQEEWLQLEYDQARAIKTVKVYETYNPGALTRIAMVDDDGKETEIWRGKDPTARDVPMGISEVPLLHQVMAKRIKIYLDSVNVPGWNEIDAVGVVDEQDAVHWAVKATASSTYAEQRVVQQPVIPPTPVRPPKPPEGGQF